MRTSKSTYAVSGATAAITVYNAGAMNCWWLAVAGMVLLVVCIIGLVLPPSEEGPTPVTRPEGQKED